jgi:hypothetical protein
MDYQLLSLKSYNVFRTQQPRLICKISQSDHITPTLYKLHWLPIKFRIDFKVLLITSHKALHGLAPQYFTDIIMIKPKSGYNLRSDSELLLQKPKVKSLSTLDDRSFAFAARHAKTVDSFKKLLKTYFFKQAVY